MRNGNFVVVFLSKIMNWCEICVYLWKCFTFNSKCYEKERSFI